jgi:hypothetical protein
MDPDALKHFASKYVFPVAPDATAFHKAQKICVTVTKNAFPPT